MNCMKDVACVVLSVALLQGVVAGQSAADKKPSTAQQSTQAAEPPKSTEPSMQKVLSVLDQLIEAQSSFQDADLRTAIRAQVADLLWSYDEPRARRLFDEAFLAMVNAPVRERNIWVAPLGPDSHNSVRNFVIPALIRRDSALAARLAENISDTPPETEPKHIAGGPDQHSERSLIRSQIASYLSYQDPLRAAQVAKVFAKRGEIMHLEHLLREIRRKEPKAADDLFILALGGAKLRQPSLADIRWFGSYLFPNFGEGVVRQSSVVGKRDPFLSIKIDPQVVSQFLELAYEATQRVASNSNPDRATSKFDHTIIKLLAPYFDRFMPDRAAAFRALAEEASRLVPAEERSYVAINLSGTVQELLARAETLTETRHKDELYNRASTQALMSRNFDQAAAILEKITNENSRANARFNLRLRMYQHSSEETERALERDDFEKAESLIAATSDPDLRLQLLWRFIERLVLKDRVRAIQMLAEAERTALSLEDGVQRVRHLIGFAGVAARIDADRGFDEMKLAVIEFNQAGFAPEWVRYRQAQSNNGADKDPRLTNIGLSFLRDDRDLESLGSKDFSRALAIAREIQMKEASALAQLAVCRGALSKVQAPALPKTTSPAK